MRHFIVVDDVESGEMGYAMSTLEAVLSYLTKDSGVLKKASRRNKRLWQATSKGNINEMMKILEPEKFVHVDSEMVEEPEEVDNSVIDSKTLAENSTESQAGSFQSSPDYWSENSTLDHVFPFRISDPSPFVDPLPLNTKRNKRVSMETRSMSISSEISFHSRATTLSSGLEGDTSIERLCQTQDSNGNSIMMMAIQNSQVVALKYLLG